MRSIEEAPISNKRVFLRMDYNVGIVNGEVIDDYKIRSSFSTILDVYKKNPTNIIIGSHLGRPVGQYDEKLSCRPVYNVLKKLIKNETGEDLEFCRIEDYKGSKMTMVENLRFYPEEQEISSSNTFNTILSSFFKNHIDTLVIDSFGVLHRNDYSVCKTGLVPYAGNLVFKELSVGREVLKEGVDLIILGGSKIKDKISILESLIPRCKSVFVVGALACSFLKYHFRIEVGKSKVEGDAEEVIKKIYKLSSNHKVKIYVTHDFKVLCNDNYFYTKEVPKEGEVVDIGAETLEQLREVIKNSKNVFWNGPPGIFENYDSSCGSKELVKMLSKMDKVIVGGGETSACVRKFGNVDDFFHVSTGGGAFLKLLGHEKMPGVDILE